MQVVADFYAVMGEEMIALTGQRQRVEAIINHIVSVTTIIENVDFDPFHVDNAKLWAAVMVTFWQVIIIIILIIIIIIIIIIRRSQQGLQLTRRRVTRKSNTGSWPTVTSLYQ